MMIDLNNINKINNNSKINDMHYIKVTIFDENQWNMMTDFIIEKLGVNFGRSALFCYCDMKNRLIQHHLIVDQENNPSLSNLSSISLLSSSSSSSLLSLSKLPYKFNDQDIEEFIFKIYEQFDSTKRIYIELEGI